MGWWVRGSADRDGGKIYIRGDDRGVLGGGIWDYVRDVGRDKIGRE